MTVRSTGHRNGAGGGPDAEGAVAAGRNLTATGALVGAGGARRSFLSRQGSAL